MTKKPLPRLLRQATSGWQRTLGFFPRINMLFSSPYTIAVLSLFGEKGN